MMMMISGRDVMVLGPPHDGPNAMMWIPTQPPPLPSSRHHRSNGYCLEGKRENYQVYSVKYCVPYV